MIPRRTLKALAEAHVPAAYTGNDQQRDFRAVLFRDQQAERVLLQVMEACGYFASPRVQASLDAAVVGARPMVQLMPAATPEELAFAEGRRSVAVWLASVLDREIPEPQLRSESKDAG